MRGYLQRLIGSRNAQGPGVQAPVRPALPSRSPVAEADQRLNIASLADAVAAFAPDTPQADASAQPVGESRTVPSYRSQPAARRAVPAQPAATQNATVPRYAMPLPAAPPAALPSSAPPSRPAPATPAAPIGMDLPRLEHAAPAAAPHDVPDMRRPAIPDSVPGRAASDPLPLPPVTLPEADLSASPHPPRAPDASVAEPFLEPIDPAVPESPRRSPITAETSIPEPRPAPRIPMPESEIRLPPAGREIMLGADEPAHAPPAPPQPIVIRETIRTPEPAPPPKSQPLPQKLPRTAAEASVIGPLPRSDLERARAELWLR